MKILWISGILIGFGLIAYGAITYYHGSETGGYLMLTGFACKSIGLLARRQVFKRRQV